MSAASARRVAPAISRTIHRFTHEAMACTWELFIAGQTAEISQQAAWAAWDEVDRLESELSRFLPDSDVSQINALQPGETLLVGLAALECLCLAGEIHRDTGGAFDVTIGALMDEQRRQHAANAAANGAAGGAAQNPQQPQLFPDPGMAGAAGGADAAERVGFELLEINEEERLVGVQRAGVTVDLGGIGKGYALDRLAEVLRDWSITSALLTSGQSIVVALSAPPRQDANENSSRNRALNGVEDAWMVALRDPRGPDNQNELPGESRLLGAVPLRDGALSGSGMRLHGRHILDPRGGDSASERAGGDRAGGKLATWALAPSAARSDALSTAFMVMTADEIESYCRRHPGVSALLLEDPDNPVSPQLVGFGELRELKLEET